MDLDDEAQTERILKRKVKNARTNLFEWTKCRCLVVEEHFVCEEMSNTNVKRMEILLANILAIHPKAASRFEVTHATSNGHETDEFMAPTPQHCQLWMRQLKQAVAASLNTTRPTSPIANSKSSRLRHDLPRLKIPSPLTSPIKSMHLQDDSKDSMEKSPPSEGHISLDEARHLDDTTLMDPQHDKPLLPWKDAETSPSECSEESNKASVAARRYTPSEAEAEEQLGILVRVEGALKQLEVENKLSLQRETSLRHELVNLQDSMRLLNLEKQELLTQLRDVTAEREEWKAIARRKQDELTQLRDDLQVAKDEIRLLTNEQLRLTHRNRDLAVHVQRLDTLVYGKF
ncbi:hypothetical protein Ae201684P_011094 [Aphanomyces euteiches]|uniref:PH domain-containing protein n=1 Tax=Aphanomyces euteiches TaxID=100861 RepID=A0A6G0XYS6_9STRA|nr:hypothetical protein Ae201684_000128 [Aphanomyces euteiches]KAH9091549.1 hypothetical protein Ae201684P_011094 [Aphanomyces euteiches]KAH9146222.1 hypothetical protein AeRB84_009894 [Aphanomyces euteiches]